MITQEFLGKICDIKTGKLDVNAESPRGKYPFFTCAETPVKIDFYDYDCECVLIAGNGEFAVNYYNGKFNAYQRTYIVTAKDEFKDETYLPYLYAILKRAILELKGQSQGSIIQYLRLPQLETLEIPFPKPNEQKRIAAILDKADRLRRQRRFAQTLSDSFLQSVFIEMFGNPLSNPKGFDVKKIGTQIKNIRYGTGSPPDYQDKGVPFVRATNVKGGTIRPKDMAFISESDAKEIPKCRVREGDMIIVRSGVNTGDCALIPKKYNGAYAAYDLIVEIDYPTNHFYNSLINSDEGKAVILPLTRRAGQPHLNAEQVSDLEFPIPPLPLQEKFAAIVQKFERVRRQQREAVRQAEHLFQTLLHRAFRGEL